MKNYFLIVLFCLSIISKSKAQFEFWKASNKDAVTAMAVPTLYIEILEVSESALKKMKTQEEIDAYKEEIEYMNSLIKSSFDKYWFPQKKLVYKTESEIYAMVEENKKENFLVLLHGPSLNTRPDIGPDQYMYKVWYGTKGKLTSVFGMFIELGSRATTEVDFKFLIYNLCKYFQANAEGKTTKDLSLYDPDKNFEVLKQKTLLFDQEMLDTAALSYDMAKSMYPHKIKFVTAAEIYEAVEREDSTVLFMTQLRNTPFGLTMFAIVDAQSMNIMAMQPLNRVYFGLGRQVTGLRRFDHTRPNFKPSSLWLNRPKSQFNEKDFKYLGSYATVKGNYR